MFKVVVCILILASFSAWADEGKRTFLIGIQERPLYREKSPSGEWSGIDIDIVQAVFAQSPFQFELVESPWQRILKEVELGAYDMALSAAKTPERERYARFSTVPFRQGHNMLFVGTEHLQALQNITQLSDLKGRKFKLGVLRGISYSDEFDQLSNQSWFKQSLVVLDQADRLPQMLLLGRIEGYLDSEYGGQQRVNTHSEYAGKIKALAYMTTEQEAQTFLMFSKLSVSEEDVAVFDAALAQIRELGILEQILNHRIAIRPAESVKLSSAP
ncbi:transporter substrate-binding domain-containing protein [Aliiglaciecola sp. CAU 1673]|uniref:substrate-binding periplasmic protein n=1 Tax=Aliiglaciecola sp. CAU 1673 TaxID=3032595 RepID=UPI0023DC1215|nr:transporter substrate-binding domain-containing protein [Aliiglaciecola sp. CAU 1673]MDF2179161.1 transporter substrate-binding domain-containing protein [Aliiglaciecola sp. CAU 1673]